MAASACYSHKQLDGKSGPEKQELLFQVGVNFNDYPAEFKRGVFVRRVVFDRLFTADELARIPPRHRPSADKMVTRSEVRAIPMPPFGQVVNRDDVIFNGTDPITARDAISDAA